MGRGVRIGVVADLLLFALLSSCSAPTAKTAVPGASADADYASGGRGDDDSGTSGGSGGSLLSDANVPDKIADQRVESDSADDIGTPPAGDAGNGDAGLAANSDPVAEGKIVFSQDFETGRAGMSPSPGDLPADRITIVSDPLGLRGQVAKIVWQAGDNYRTSPGTLPRSWFSNSGYSFPLGARVSYAWGYMTSTQNIEAGFAQHIRANGPIWMLQGNDIGEVIVACCGGTTNTKFRLETLKWYDFRLEFNYANGADGSLAVFINGSKIYERVGLGLTDPAGSAAHWDGGIYNTHSGLASNLTRTVYLSNLSVGIK